MIEIQFNLHVGRGVGERPHLRFQYAHRNGVKDARRSLIEHFPKVLPPDDALQRPQVFGCAIGQDVCQEMHRIRQCLDRRFEPHPRSAITSNVGVSGKRFN